MSAYFRFVLRRGAWFVAAAVVLTVIAVVLLTRTALHSSLPDLLFGEDAAFQRYRQRLEAFGGDEQLVVGFETAAVGDDPRRLEGIAACIEQVSGVRRVDRLSALPGVGRLSAFPNDGGVAPLVEGLLCSADRRHTAVVVEVMPDTRRTLEQAPVFEAAVVSCFETAGVPHDALHLTGLLAVTADIQRQLRSNLSLLLPVVAAVLLAATWALFRQVWPVVMTAVVGAMAVLWTFGAVLLFGTLNLMVAVCPPLILLVSFSDVVHLCSTCMLERQRGHGRVAAVLRTARAVGRACLITSLTTLVGFLGLTLMDVPGLRQAGWVLGVGVAMALLVAVTYVPLFLLRWDLGSAATQRTRAVDAVDHTLGWTRRTAARHPRWILAVTAVLMGLSLWSLQDIRIETDFVARMGPTSRLRRDVTYFDDHFSGSTLIDVFITPEPGADWRDDLRAAHRGVAGDPRVRKVVSLATLETAGWSGFHVPAGLGALAALHDPASHTLRMMVFLERTGMVACHGVATDLARQITAGWSGPVTVEPSGMMVLSGAWIGKHLLAERRAVLTSVAVIALILAVLFRSLRIGLWSMVPNVLPLLLLGGVLGWRGVAVDSDLVVVVLVAIGIAVDDTIHFLTRYTTEIRRSRAGALDRTFDHAGRAIVMTSLIFAAGFAPFALSAYLPMTMIGVLLPGVMIAALLADLLVLPALIHVGAIRVATRGDA